MPTETMTQPDIPFAERMRQLGTETAFEVLARAKALEAQGRSVIHLEIGEPDFDTPRNIVEAGVQALRDGYTHYGPAAGLPEVREAIARMVRATRGVDRGPDNVVVTPGAKPIMFYVMLALVDPGDEVVYPNPGFPIYESMAAYVGASLKPIRLREENDFRLDVDELQSLVTSKTKLIVINSPQNPTGGMLTAADLRAIGAAAAETGAYVLADEIYSRIVYEGRHESILRECPDCIDRIILLDGMSKTYAMTGWRLGWGVMHAGLAAAVARLQTNANSCTASFSQRVIPEALFGPQDEVVKMVAEFKRRRDVMVDGLNAIDGLSCRRPRGAFYVFPNITQLGMTARQVADRLLTEAGVAALAGTSFGSFGEGYLRFSYANSVENIQTALERIRSWVAGL